MPSAPTANISRSKLNEGRGAWRINICRATSMKTLAIVNRIVITPSAFVPASYAYFARVGPIEKPRLDIMTSAVPITLWFFSTFKI
jgi:hypothetical protein